MKNSLLLGCIADDFTGASDLANTLAQEGMRTTQLIGTPPQDYSIDSEAAVVSLKSRSIPAAEAIEQSLEALHWLQQQGATQFLFKYCSTFDSTAEGNIGPVAEALADALDTHAVIVCPAFPTTGRTVYQGHLFVFDKLLNESGLQNHPLNPMTDADIRRWLASQCKTQPTHIDHSVVVQGPKAIERALSEVARERTRLVVVDAIVDEDLRAIGAASADAKLLTGGSGIALGLPENFRRKNLLKESGDNYSTQTSSGVILCGSCSEATRQQIKAYDGPHFPVDVPSLMNGSVTAESVALQLPTHTAPLIYSSADPDTIKDLQATYGRNELANAIEAFFGSLAATLFRQGRRRIVVAGGETSGAVISALSLNAFNIGPEIDPGVPALSTVDNSLAVALKSGNFGAEDFFEKALNALGDNNE